ncbi:hypothetical protein K1719_006939 [Acacia pycnantha]|nr:hypothetical protein K1719_006939 [Acacia pycnantha]
MIAITIAITMLSWSTKEFRDKLAAKKELSNKAPVIKWGADYFMKAHPQLDVLYGKVGDADSNHDCWQRPEDITTPHYAFQNRRTELRRRMWEILRCRGTQS